MKTLWQKYVVDFFRNHNNQFPPDKSGKQLETYSIKKNQSPAQDTDTGIQISHFLLFLLQLYLIDYKIL